MSEFEGFEPDPELPERDVESGELVEPESLPLTSNEAEQRLRELYGYAPSEARTEAERQATADRIIAKNKDTITTAREIWNRQADRAGSPGSTPAPKPKRIK